MHGPLAQLDRASGYGPEGQGFESLMLRHENLQTNPFGDFLCHAKDANSCIDMQRTQLCCVSMTLVRLHARQMCTSPPPRR